MGRVVAEEVGALDSAAARTAVSQRAEGDSPAASAGGVAGVIQRRTTWPPSPSEYLVRSGRIIATAEGELEVRRKRLWEHPLVVDSALGSGKVAAGLSRALVPEVVLAKGR